MAQMWKGAVVVHFILVAGGVFFWNFLLQVVTENKWNILLQPGVELHLGLCLASLSFRGVLCFLDWLLRVSADNSR